MGEPINDTFRRVLERLEGGRTTATHWMCEAAGRNTAATRRLLRRMATLGLVEPRPYSSGRAYHWGITASGQAVLDGTRSPTAIEQRGEG